MAPIDCLFPSCLAFLEMKKGTFDSIFYPGTGRCFVKKEIHLENEGVAGSSVYTLCSLNKSFEYLPFHKICKTGLLILVTARNHRMYILLAIPFANNLLFFTIIQTYEFKSLGVN